MIAVLFIPLLASLVAAQQNVLVDGTSQLPACAQQCPLLQQANAACTGTGTPQAAWTCFCQSAYLTQLYTTAVGICDSTCTDATQNAQVSTWYNSNCGTDFGVSEHAGDTATTATTPAADPAAAPTDTSDSTNSGSDSGSTSNSNTGTTSANTGSGSGRIDPTASSGDWWSNHYQWIVMVIVLAIAFPLLAWLMIWLKRRHDRKQDLPTGGFNTGITERSAPTGAYDEKQISSVATPVPATRDVSGRNSPVRTREAFMPYGYGYSRSESRLNSSHGVDQRPSTSPLANGVMNQEHGGLGPWPAEAKSLSRRG